MKIFYYLISFILFVPLVSLARAGASESEYTTGAAGIALGFFAYLYIKWLVKRKKQKAHKIIENSSTEDKSWQLTKLEKTTKDIFYKIQNDWSEGVLDEGILTEPFILENKKRIEDIKSKNLINKLEDITLLNIEIIGAKNFADNENDSFYAYLEFTMKDYFVDKATGEFVKGDRKGSKYIEVWEFEMDKNLWKLNKIINSNITDFIKNLKSFKEEN